MPNSAAPAPVSPFNDSVLPLAPILYITAPRYHGTNSSCPNPCISLRVGWPEHVASMSSKIFLPASCTVTEPSRISPQLMSMSSSIRWYMGVFVASLIEGDGLHPYTEPGPVVKQTRLAPPATWPVAE